MFQESTTINTQSTNRFLSLCRGLSDLTSRFNPFRTKPPPVLKAIFIAPAAGKPMQSITTVTAIHDRGLQGDRYHDNTGHWQYNEGCQVTLITEHELEQSRKRTDIPLDGGAHRRNLVVDNIKPRRLEGRRFKIGEVIFEYEKPRPPCGYIDQVEGRGIGRALSHNSGICIRVIKSGTLSIGDPLDIITP